MKYLISTAFLLLTCWVAPCAFGQEMLTYQGATYQRAMNQDAHYQSIGTLKRVLAADPYDAVAYHLMGYMYYERYREYDLLQDYKGATLLVDSAFFYFQKARDLLNPKDMKKNGSYYSSFFNFKDPKNATNEVQIPVILTDIQQMTEEGFQFQKQASGIYTFFNRSLENYKRANTIYLETCERFPAKQDLLLLADKQLFDDFDYMARAYDSTIVYFENYKKTLQDFPIKKYDQRYTVVPILRYQEEGKERANFFADTFTLWDYKKWQKEIQTEIKDKISLWRERIQVYEDRLNADLSRAMSVGEGSSTPFTLDQAVIEAIRQYEENSSLEYVFNYKVGKLNLFNTLYARPDSNATFAQRVQLNLRNIASIRDCRFLLEDIGKSTSLSLARHRDFFKKNYADGLPSFVANEQLFLDERTAVVNKQLAAAWQKKAQTLRGIAADSLIHAEGVLYRIPVPKSTNIRTETTREGVFVTLASVSLQGIDYISGFTKKAGKHHAFVAALATDSVQWLVYPEIPTRDLVGDAHTEAAALHLSPMGLAVAAYAFVEGEKGFGHTTLLRHEITTGDIKETVQVNNKIPSGGSYPRYLHYDTKGHYQLVLKSDGEPTLASYTLQKALLLSCTSAGELTWQKEIELHGEVVALQAHENRFLLLCNFKEIRIAPGHAYNAETAEVNPRAYNVVLVRFEKDGEVNQVNFVPQEEPVYAQVLVATAQPTEVIGVFGFYGEADTAPSSAKPLIQVLDAALQPLNDTEER